MLALLMFAGGALGQAPPSDPAPEPEPIPAATAPHAVPAAPPAPTASPAPRPAPTATADAGAGAPPQAAPLTPVAPVPWDGLSVAEYVTGRCSPSSSTRAT
jgi:hypothetical protein